MTRTRRSTRSDYGCCSARSSSPPAAPTTTGTPTTASWPNNAEPLSSSNPSASTATSTGSDRAACGVRRAASGERRDSRSGLVEGLEAGGDERRHPADQLHPVIGEDRAEGSVQRFDVVVGVVEDALA